MLHLGIMSFFKKTIFFIILTFLLISCGENNVQETEGNSSANSHLRIARTLDTRAINIYKELVLEFTAKIDPTSLQNSAIYLRDANKTTIKISVKLDPNNTKRLIISPYKYFKPLKNYVLVVTKKLRDIRANSLSKNYILSFVTAAARVPISKFNIVLFKPSVDKIDVDIHSNIALEFNRFISKKNIENFQNILEVRDINGFILEGKVSVQNALITFKPSKTLEAQTTYTVKLTNPIVDMYGNIYDNNANISQWSFTTRNTTSSYTKDGFANIVKLELAKTIYGLRTLKNSANKSWIILASSNNLDLYSISYLLPVQKPVVKKVFSLDIPYEVSSLSVVDEKFLIVASKAEGIYTYKVDEKSIEAISHIVLKEFIYSVYAQKDKVYSSGPKDGLRLFSLGVDGSLSELKHVTLATSTMLDVLARDNRVFVADYEGGVLVYDSDLLLQKRVSLDASVKKLLKDPLGDGIIAFNSIGKISHIDLNANLLAATSIELASNVQSISSLSKNTLLKKIFIIDEDNGVLILDASLQNLTAIEKKNILFSDALMGYTSEMEFLAVVQAPSVLSIVNTNSDTDGVKLSMASLKDGFLELNSSIVFQLDDAHIDSQQINKQNIIFTDDLRQKVLDYNISLKSLNDNSIECSIKTKRALIEDNNYTLSVKKSLKDMLGNELQNGDYTLHVKGHNYSDANLTLSALSSVVEGTNVQYTISLTKVAKIDVDVGVVLKNISTTTKDVQIPAQTYTIKAGTKEVSFTLKTTDNNYENRAKKYTVELVDIKKGAGYRLLVDTSAIQTTITNNDTASITTISAPSVVEGKILTHTVTISTTAEYTKVYTYALPITGNTGTATAGSDYSVTPTVGTEVTINTSNKTISVPAGVTSFTFNVVSIDDTAVESSETYNLQIGIQTGSGTITDNDAAAAPTTAPTNNNQFAILNRAFWSHT